MSRSDHNRSRSPRGYIAIKRQRIRATRHLARRLLHAGATDIPPMKPARSQCGHGCCW